MILETPNVGHQGINEGTSEIWQREIELLHRLAVLEDEAELPALEAAWKVECQALRAEAGLDDRLKKKATKGPKEKGSRKGKLDAEGQGQEEGEMMGNVHGGRTGSVQVEPRGGVTSKSALGKKRVKKG